MRGFHLFFTNPLVPQSLSDKNAKFLGVKDVLPHKKISHCAKRTKLRPPNITFLIRLID